MLELSGPSQKPADGQPPRALVVLLHGLGADGNDLIGLAPYWAPHLPHVEFVSPNAPFPCDMAPYGRQWFSLQDRSPDAVLAGVRMAWGILDGFLDAELARTGLAADRLALVGFSQGTMMSLFTGPRRAERIAGIVGYSGRLVGAEALAAELKSRPPVTLVHGDADEILPVSSLPEAVKGLEAAGIEVASTVRPRLGHSIDETGLRIGLEFLRRVLPA
jgi:phospholipase/carboxylesterase